MYTCSYIGMIEKKMETTIVYWGYIAIMEKKMETTLVYWRYIGRMEKKIETTYMGYEQNHGARLVIGYITAPNI